MELEIIEGFDVVFKKFHKLLKFYNSSILFPTSSTVHFRLSHY